MTATTINVHLAHRSLAPRGANPLAELFAAAYQGVQRLGKLLHREPDHFESVQAVLAMAREYERTQPGFAADLRAAACRFDGELDR
ncbi:hypothetical protein OOT46_10775 [Aquabacterium sp. A7-Y]|uniref:hypothetical protein n=1 Tax=Aquabacterium sp. A7-Y TaxID=1349605 RepID=UPI00223D6200|nr:hypothetical protein [Aquabacterium sp. A7-Y]MCW7538323.1 hypothetical protein [Aquabacterium sp. A7-Y]